MPNAPMLNAQPSLLGQQPPTHPMAGPGPQQYSSSQFPPPQGHGMPQHSAGWGPSSAPQSTPLQMHNHPYMQPANMAPGMMQFHSQNGLPRAMPPYQPQ